MNKSLLITTPPGLFLGLFCLIGLSSEAVCCANDTMERWGLAEISFRGPDENAVRNPFEDVTLAADFQQDQQRISVTGFYDGSGDYRLRFSPPTPGKWTYKTRSNRAELDAREGQITAVEPTGVNHGPVQVAHTFHFAYADGKIYRPFGTTCYAWIHQPDPLPGETLETLKKSPFNKLRMCIFPKHYEYNSADPMLFPFEGTPGKWDTSRFRPEFFRQLEKHIVSLQKMEIEADLILFHPYDKGRWGFDRMTAEEDARFLKYVAARLAAYRNVWWSMANEYDFMEKKVESDWDRLAEVLVQSDPFGRLRSIHNGTRMYNHNQPWVTHASIQNGSAVAEPGRAVLYRDAYRKPIVLDEVKYEGNLPQRWGNLSAKEMVHRFWVGTLDGTYVGHGETYLHPDHAIWWAKGGQLRGESPQRIAFLRQIVETGPARGIDPIDKWQESRMGGSQADNYFLVYLGREATHEWKVAIPAKERPDNQPLPNLRAEIIDCWNMTITPVPGEFKFQKSTPYYWTCADHPVIPLPGHSMTAIRLQLAGKAQAAQAPAEHFGTTR